MKTFKTVLALIMVITIETVFCQQFSRKPKQNLKENETIVPFQTSPVSSKDDSLPSFNKKTPKVQNKTNSGISKDNNVKHLGSPDSNLCICGRTDIQKGLELHKMVDTSLCMILHDPSMNNRSKHYIDTIEDYKKKIDTALKQRYESIKNLNKKLSELSKTRQFIIDAIKNPIKSNNSTDFTDRFISTCLSDTLHVRDTIAKYQKSLIQAKNNLEVYKKDSLYLTKMVIGGNNDIGLWASYFLGISSFADDNPNNFSSFHFHVSVPWNRLKGVIINPKNSARVIGFRNLDINCYGVFNKYKLYAHETDSADIKNKIIKRWVNLLDLKQYNFFTMTLKINAFTLKSPGFTLYFDGIFSFSRTMLMPTMDSLYPVNFWQEGISLTGETQFNYPLNIKISTDMFWISPMKPSLTFSNIQYSKLSHESNLSRTFPHLSEIPFCSVHITFGYDLTTKYSSSNDKITQAASSSSSISGTGLSLIYLTFGYDFSSPLIFKPYGNRDFNSYMTFRVGYSLNVETLLKLLKNALGIG